MRESIKWSNNRFVFFILLSVLYASVATGEVEEVKGLDVQFPGRVFLYCSDCEQGSSAIIDSRDSETLLPDLSPFTRNRSALQGNLLPRGFHGRSLENRAGSERIKPLSLILDEGGMPRDVLCIGDYCYVGTTGNLAILDVTDPNNPVLVNEIDGPTPKLDASGSLMAVVNGRFNELAILDITDPTSPVEISRLSPPENFIYRSLSMSSSLLVATGMGGLEGFGPSDLMQVIDISDPYAPQVKSSLLGVGKYYPNVLLEQDTAYLNVSPDGLVVLDVSSPESPIQTGFILTSSWIEGSDYESGLLYLPGNGLEIVDVSDPANLTLVSQWGVPSTADVEVSGGYAYITDDDDNTLHVVDVTDPANPFEVGILPAYGKVYFLDVAGDKAYFADMVYGLLVVDISTPSAPSLMSMTSTGHLPHGVDVDSGLAAVTANYGTLHMLDVSDPYAPELLGTYLQPPDTIIDNTALHEGVDLEGGVAVTNDSWHGFHTFDVTDPAVPDRKGGIVFGRGIFPAALSGNLVYSGKTQIFVYDISDPANPLQVGTGPDLQDFLYEIIIAGTTGYACSESEVVIFDLTDPVNPLELSRFATTEGVIAMALDGDVLGVGQYYSGGTRWLALVDFFDVSDPYNPLLLSSIQDPDLTFPSRMGNCAMSAEDGLFYVCGQEHLNVIDARDPQNAYLAGVYPETRGSWWVGWFAYRGVHAEDGLVYLCGHTGTEILRFLDVGAFLDPGTDPVVVPRGGSFSYDVEVENFTDVVQTCDVWIDVEMPGGSFYGPLAGPATVTLNPGQNIGNTLMHQVPGNAPVDTYLLWVHVGTYPGVELDNDRFTLEITP